MSEIINNQIEKFIQKMKDNMREINGAELTSINEAYLRMGIQHGILIAGRTLIEESGNVKIKGE